MPPQPVAAVFGGTRIGNRQLFMPDTHLEAFLTTLTRHPVTKIDTAQAYGNSEATLGRIQARQQIHHGHEMEPIFMDRIQHTVGYQRYAPPRKASPN